MSDAKEVEGKQTQAVAIESVQYYSNKASVNDLKENTTYYYQVFQNGKFLLRQGERTPGAHCGARFYIEREVAERGLLLAGVGKGQMFGS